MAKFALVLLALVAIQGCYGASLGSPRLNDLEEVVKEYAVTIKDLNEVISFISGHLSSVSRDYTYQITEIVEKLPVYPVVAELRETITKLESTTDESKSCFSAAWTSTSVATEEMKRGLDNCISEAHTTGGHITSILQTVDGKATHLQAELVAGFHKCMQQGNVGKEAVKCLREVIVPLKEQLVNLKAEVHNAHELVHEDIEDATRDLNNCLLHVKEDVSLKSENILGNLNKCIKGDNVSKFATRGILDFFKELKEKIESIIHIVSHLPTSIEEIPDKINEIISHINISALYSQLKSEVHDIIKDGGRDAEKCRPEADEQLNTIVKTAEDTAKACMGATEGKVEVVEAEFEVLVKEAKELLEDLNKQALQCFLDNKLNPIEFAKCLEGHADGFKERISALQKKVTDTIEKAKKQAEELLNTLASCVNTVQLDTIKKGQQLIAEVEKCVQNSHLLF